MKLLKYAVRSMKASKKRTLTYFFFIFIVTVILSVFDSFVITVTDKMKDSMSGILYGDLLIRPEQDKEDIYVSAGNWKETFYVDNSRLNDVYDFCKNQSQVKDISPRIRFSGMISTETNQDMVMIMSLESNSLQYKDYISLVDGHYLTEKDKDSIFLDKAKADALQVNIGDTVTLLVEGKEGVYATKEFQVIGIGNPEMLLSMSVAYIDYEGAKDILTKIGVEKDSVSDIVVYANRDKDVSGLQKKINQILKENNQSDVYVMNSLKSDGFIIGTLNFYIKLFYVFIIVLMMIVCILLVNLVIMMGLQRRQEIGTLRSIGFKRGQIIRIMLYEITMITATACVLGGVLVSVVLYNLRNTVFEMQEPVSFITGSKFVIHLDVSGMLLVILIVFVLSIVASFFPAKKIASIRPVETLKEV